MFSYVGFGHDPPLEEDPPPPPPPEDELPYPEELEAATATLVDARKEGNTAIESNMTENTVESNFLNFIGLLKNKIRKKKRVYVIYINFHNPLSIGELPFYTNSSGRMSNIFFIIHAIHITFHSFSFFARYPQ